MADTDNYWGSEPIDDECIKLSIQMDMEREETEKQEKEKLQATIRRLIFIRNETEARLWHRHMDGVEKGECKKIERWITSRRRWADARERLGNRSFLVRPFIGRLSQPRVSEKTLKSRHAFTREHVKMLVRNEASVN